MEADVRWFKPQRQETPSQEVGAAAMQEKVESRFEQLPDFLQRYTEDPDIKLKIAKGQDPYPAAARAFIREITADRSPASLEFFNSFRLRIGELMGTGLSEREAYAELLRNVAGSFSPVSFDQGEESNRNKVDQLVNQFASLYAQMSSLMESLSQKFSVIYIRSQAESKLSAAASFLNTGLIRQAMRAADLHDRGTSRLPAEQVGYIVAAIGNLRESVARLSELDQATIAKQYRPEIKGLIASPYGYSLGGKGVAALMSKALKPQKEAQPAAWARVGESSANDEPDGPGFTHLERPMAIAQ